MPSQRGADPFRAAHHGVTDPLRAAREGMAHARGSAPERAPRGPGLAPQGMGEMRRGASGAPAGGAGIAGNVVADSVQLVGQVPGVGPRGRRGECGERRERGGADEQ